MIVFLSVVGFLIVFLLCGGVIYQLKTRRLYDQSRKACVNCQDNSVLYWSSILLETFCALMLHLLLGVFGARTKKGLCFLRCHRLETDNGELITCY